MISAASPRSTIFFCSILLHALFFLFSEYLLYAPFYDSSRNFEFVSSNILWILSNKNSRNQTDYFSFLKLFIQQFLNCSSTFNSFCINISSVYTFCHALPLFFRSAIINTLNIMKISQKTACIFRKIQRRW